MALVLGITAELQLQTRCENQILNEIHRGPTRPGDVLAVEDFKLKYPKARHRPVGPSRRYNCHGLSFASRRTMIWDPVHVAQIIKDDDYERVVDIKSVMPGDIAAYTVSGDIEHSGIVVNMKEFYVPVILSKWGVCQEVIHDVGDCPYDSSNVLYYRIVI
jgi:hypothetical protein